MTPPSGFGEDTLVERPAIELLQSLGWEYFSTYSEFDHGPSPVGRETRCEVDVSELDITFPEETGT